MNKNFMLCALAFTLLSASCVDDIKEPDEGVNDPEKDKVEVVDPFIDGISLNVSARYMVTTTEDGAIDSYFPMKWPEESVVAINGIASERMTYASLDSTAVKFDLSDTIPGPYVVTYPYTSVSTAQTPKVIFPATQICQAGKIDVSMLPLCGKSQTAEVTLRNLAGALQLNVKSTSGAVMLTKVSLTSVSKSKLAGEFDVDCDKLTMTPAPTAGSVINYIFPEGVFVTQGLDGSLFLNLPAGFHGECTLVLYDASGSSMEVTIPSVIIQAGVVSVLDAFEYNKGTSLVLGMPGSNKATGYVRDTNGNPIAGVPVTDGFTVVTTDADGYYSIGHVSTDSWFIYYSTPAEYEVAVNAYGQPCFWKDYVPGTTRYDFTLKPLAGGVEKEFALFTYGDPQVYSDNNVKRFLNEAVPGIKAHANSLSIPKYGIGLGDIVFNTDNYMVSHQMPKMRDGFSVNSVGMPVFQTLGNHDQTEFNASKPLETDARNSDVNLKARQDFQSVFGPVDYSFNRGDVHIIGMKNVQFSSATSSQTGHYHGGFTDDQYEWLKQDLALVPKDKHIIICFHIPLYDCVDKMIPELKTHTNVSNVMNLLSQYENVSIMSGHVHTQRNYQHPNGIWEYNAVAVSGAWWRCCISADGAPNGFNVYVMQGNKMKDAYFYGYTASSSTRSHQMRLYRGNAACGAEISGENKNGTAGYYGFNFGDDVILANVYNGSSLWTVSVYEDGVYSGDMTMLPSKQPALNSLIGDYTFGNPRRAADGVETGHDFWVTGYLMGVSGNNSSNGGYKECYHMYKYKLKNKNASIKVVAQDPWGTTYEETVITEGTDFSAAEKP